MKIINPIRRKKPIIRNLHEFKGKFQTVSQLKSCIMDELHDELPEDPVLDVGYFETHQSSKVWIVSPKDLEVLYEKVKNGGEICLWIQVCDTDESDSDNPEPRSKKKKHSESSKRQKEDLLEEVYSKLKLKHDDMYTAPQLKLWARMIICGTHDDYNDPPHVPMITGMHSKKPKKDSLSDALTGAAEAVARHFSPPPPVSASTASVSACSSIGTSPGKSTKTNY